MILINIDEIKNIYSEYCKTEKKNSIKRTLLNF